MPLHHFPPNAQPQTLPLLDLGRAQSCKVLEIFRIKKSVGIVLLNEETGERLCWFRVFRRE